MDQKRVRQKIKPVLLKYQVKCPHNLSLCDMYLGNEGGFGHAAAALNKKALIYFGGWISPQSTGYDKHENVYYDDPNSPCGAIGYICDHCEKARQSVNVDYLEEKVKLLLK